MLDLEPMAAAARAASRLLAELPTGVKNALLLDVAARLAAARQRVLDANARDLDAARAAGLAPAKLQRLMLSPAGLDQLARGLEQVAALPDPVGQITRTQTVPSGLRVRRERIPLGVICMIYEARPGVTLDAFALCFKAGNACILKGGKEAAHSNAALAELAHDALAAVAGELSATLGPRAATLPHALTVFSGLDREHLIALLELERHIDLVIPRGGIDLIRFVAEHSRIPTIQHFQGVCHVYVDRAARLDIAENICATAKASAPATCNAAECVLVHHDLAPTFIPRLVERFAREGVEVRGDDTVLRLCPPPATRPAGRDDFGREFLDLVVAVRVVAGLDDAIEHIERFGSGHTEAIITDDAHAARAFCRRVLSSCVLVNASTRFNDGFQLGLGAEIGISTSRLHAYGPMGLEQLTIERFVVEGDGQTR